jgi:hypothetical protein
VGINTRALSLLMVAIGCITGGCGRGGRGAHAADPAPRAEPFVAFERDFAVFRDWDRVETGPANPQGITHVAGKRRVYVNARPAAGRGVSTFPVGTMLIKEILEGAEEGHRIFAMVKRGGGYNAQGARGWEWFELAARGDGSLAIVWRGINAPQGEDYGGDPQGGCNDCHGRAGKNDFVRSPGLRL